MYLVSKIRMILKKFFPYLYKRSKKLRDLIYKNFFSKKSEINLVKNFFEYLPGGSGNLDSVNENIIYNIKNISDALLMLLDEDVEYKTIGNLNYDEELSHKLFKLFKKNGSDKYLHEYHYLYSYIISKNNIKKMLEIGLGTQNKEILSNMGNFGFPGGCLKSFSEILPEDSEIIGLDIDKEILFNNKNIRTFEFDQLNSNHISRFIEKNFETFDLVIDDGLHSNVSIVNTIHMCRKILRNKGLLVIEDLQEVQLKFLKIAFALSRGEFEYTIFKLSDVFVIVAKKLN